MTIYVIRAGEYAKIGDSTDLDRRLAQIQKRHPGCRYPADLDPGEPAYIAAVVRDRNGRRSYESALHDAFHDLRVEGEWFRFEERMERFCRRRRYDG